MRERCSVSAVGAIYAATSTRTGRLSHVRVLDPAYTRDEEALHRVHERVYGRTRVEHPNVGGGCYLPRERGCGVVAGLVYMVCSPANRVDLETLVRARGPLHGQELRRIMLHVCRGLHQLHRAGLVHGDLQPGHCFLEDDTKWVRVTGHGLAAAAGGRTDAGRWPFLAPEQLSGSAPDVRSDVHAAGALLWFLMTGRPPPREAVRGGVYRGEAWADAPALGGMQPVVQRALERDPGRRYATIRELAEEIAAVGGSRTDVEVTMMPFSLPSAPEAAPRGLSHVRATTDVMAAFKGWAIEVGGYTAVVFVMLVVIRLLESLSV